MWLTTCLLMAIGCVDFSQTKIAEIGTLNYSNQKVWAGQCGKHGFQLQSPINLEEQSLKFHRFDTPLKFQGLDKTVQVTLSNNGWMYYGLVSNPPTVSGGPLVGQHILDAMYLHTPSEHSFLGKHYPLEIEFAMTAPTGENMVILSSVLKLDFTGLANLSIVTDEFHTLGNKQSSSTISVTLDRFFPYDMDEFYYYHGSLSVPPCTNADWVIFKSKLASLSETDIQRLEEADYDSKTNIKRGSNNRDIQDINYRDVFLVVQASTATLRHYCGKCLFMNIVFILCKIV